MNWAAVSFDWNQVRAFLATVEEGSLSAAARALGLTQPTLGRQVSALETALGVVLFERVGRSLTLTQSGLELLDHVRDMGEAAGRISLAASGQSQSVQGLVRITASDVVACYLLPPILGRLRQHAPGIEVEIIASNTIRDLRRREADIAVRHVRPDQPDLITRLIKQVPAPLFAAPGYLDKMGRPSAPDQMAGYDFIGFDGSDRLINGLNGLGLNLRPENFKLKSENGVTAWEMVRHGLGVGVMMQDVADITPGVERVLPDLDVIPVPVWLTTHRELHTNRRIRIVYDLLAEALK